MLCATMPKFHCTSITGSNELQGVLHLQCNGLLNQHTAVYHSSVKQVYLEKNYSNHGFCYAIYCDNTLQGFISFGIPYVQQKGEQYVCFDGIFFTGTRSNKCAVCNQQLGMHISPFIGQKNLQKSILQEFCERERGTTSMYRYQRYWGKSFVCNQQV